MSEHPKSRYVQLEVPEFKSTIPAHLLGKLSDSERFMVETMSKLENQSDFLVKAAMQGNRENLDIDSRLTVLESWKERVGVGEPVMADVVDKVKKLWDWHQMFSGRWGVIWALALIVVPIVLKLLIDLALKKGP
jgi:hypothetical protein